MSLDFSPTPRRERGESIVPMINVVFLLLIFFLMTSQITPPEPFEVTPPEAELDNPGEAAPVLYLSAGGETAFEEARGEAAVAAFAVRAGGQDGPAPQLRADRAVPAERVAGLLKALAAAGVTNVALVVQGQ